MRSHLASTFAGILYAQCVFFMLAADYLISLDAFCNAMMETLQWKTALALYWKEIFGDSDTSLILIVLLKRREER